MQQCSSATPHSCNATPTCPTASPSSVLLPHRPSHPTPQHMTAPVIPARSQAANGHLVVPIAPRIRVVPTDPQRPLLVAPRDERMSAKLLTVYAVTLNASTTAVSRSPPVPIDSLRQPRTPVSIPQPAATCPTPRSPAPPAITTLRAQSLPTATTQAVQFPCVATAVRLITTSRIG